LLSIASAVSLAAGTKVLDGVVREASPILIRAPAVAVAGIMLGLHVFAVIGEFRTDHASVTYQGRDGQEVRYSLFFYNKSWAAHDAALDWLAAHSSPGDVVVTSTPQWLFIRTGLKAVMPPFEANPALAMKLIDSVPARYVVVDSLSFIDVSRRYLQLMVENSPERWKLVYGGDTGGSAIYRRTRSPDDF
jgi:hypothetical protein